MDTSARLNAIGSVLIYYALYGYDWEVLFRDNIIGGPCYADEKVNSKLFLRVYACVCLCV